jgi:hypothetical protein
MYMKKKLTVWPVLLSLALLFTFLAGCDNGSTSSGPTYADPVSWTLIEDDNSVFSTTSLLRVAYGNGTFVITGNDSKAWHSTDGIDWTAASDTAGLKPRGDSTTDNISGLTFGGGYFLATGGSSSNVARAFSSAGDIWTSTNLGTSNTDSFNAKGVAYGNGKWVVGGSSGRIAYANALDATQAWTIKNSNDTSFTGSSSAGFVNAVAFGNGKFVAGGGSGHTAYSPDGTTWTSTATTQGGGTGTIFGSSGFIDGIAYGKDKFVAVGTNTAASSSDGILWTEGVFYDQEGETMTVNEELNCVAFGGNYFVAGARSSGTVFYSTDGHMWTKSATVPNGITAVNGVGYGSGKFIIVGSGGKAAYAIVEL